MPHAPVYPLAITDGVTNPEGWEFLDENGDAVDLDDLVIEFTIKTHKGGDVLLRARSDDVSPYVTVSGNEVTVTLNLQTNPWRATTWNKSAWYYVDSLNGTTRETLLQGPVDMDAGSRVGG
jgi:hypothetical protein